MNSYMRKVVSVEMPTVVREHVRKTKVTEYVRGGSVMVEIVERITAKRPVAILECGHKRFERDTGTVISTAKRLACLACKYGVDLKEPQQ